MTRILSVLLTAVLALAALVSAASTYAGPTPGGTSPPAPARPGAASGALPAAAPADSLAALIAAAGDSSAYAGEDILGIFDRTDVRVEKTGLGRVHRRFLTKVLTEQGALRLSLQRFDYDPATNLIRILRVLIHRADGTVEQVATGGLADLAAPADGIYWGARMKLLSLPRLRVGDAVEVETRKLGFQIAYLEDGAGAGPGAPAASADPAASASRGPGRAEPDSTDARYLPPMRGHFYDVVTFQESYPLKEKLYRLTTRRDKPVQYAVYNGALASSLSFADSMLVYEWSSRDIPPLKEEARMPEATDVAPKVVMATVESWPEKSRWFFAVNDSVFAASQSIRDKVAELTRGLKDDDEKMAVLLHWVAQEIRYSGLSMGKGEGYTLHPGAMTFSDRCGVCKDIAGMLVTMLRAAGYTTDPVMTMAGARVEAVPADQFNHCVVAVKRADGRYTMLDPTWAPFDRATWSRYEGEQNYVIGSPQGEGLSRIRSFKPEESRLTARGVSTLEANGDLSGEMTFVGLGASDSRLRGLLSGAAPRDQALAIAGLLAPLGPRVELGAYEATDPRDFSQDARIHLRFRVPGFADAGDSVLAFVPPVLKVVAGNANISRLLACKKEDGERKSDALMWFSQEVAASERVSLPKSFRPEGGADSIRFEKDAGSLKGKCTAAGSEMRTELTTVLAKRTIPPKEWAGTAEVADSLRAFGRRFRLARRG